MTTDTRKPFPLRLAGKAKPSRMHGGRGRVIKPEAPSVNCFRGSRTMSIATGLVFR